MANPEHLEIITSGQDAIEKWYKTQPQHTGFDLSEADLRNANLEGIKLYRANLYHADLRGANLRYTNLMAAFLQEANLEGAILENCCAPRADFISTNLSNANLMNATLDSANFGLATLVGTNLADANIRGAMFLGAELVNTKLDGAIMSENGIEGCILDNIECTHFFIATRVTVFGNTPPTRIPESGYLAPGAFEDRFWLRPTIEYVFREGMGALSPAVLGFAIDTANKKDPDAGLRLLDITSRGGLPRAIIEVADKLSKKDALALVEACYLQALEQLQTEIQSHKHEKASLLEVIAQKMLIPSMEPSGQGFMSITQIAEMHKITDNKTKDKLRKRLDRFRVKNALGTDYIEHDSPGKNQATFHYNYEKIKLLIQDLL